MVKCHVFRRHTTWPPLLRRMRRRRGVLWRRGCWSYKVPPFGIAKESLGNHRKMCLQQLSAERLAWAQSLGVRPHEAPQRGRQYRKTLCMAHPQRVHRLLPPHRPTDPALHSRHLQPVGRLHRLRRRRGTLHHRHAESLLEMRHCAFEAEGIEQSASTCVVTDQGQASFCSQGFYDPVGDGSQAVPVRPLAEILGKGEITRFSLSSAEVPRLRSRSFFKVLYGFV